MHIDHATTAVLKDGVDLMVVALNGDHDDGGHRLPFVVGRPTLSGFGGAVKSS